MKLLFQKLLPAAAVLLFTIQVTAQDKVLRHIPAQTSQIVQIDLQRLQQFMKWEEVLQLPSMAQLAKIRESSKNREQFFTYLENPSTTGIDLSTPLYFFSHHSFENYIEGYKGLAGKISNLQQFTTWALNMNKTIALTKPGRVKTLIKDDMALIWDTENFVIVNDLMARRHRETPLDTSIINTFKGQQGDTLSDAFANLMKFLAPAIGELVAEKVTRSFDENAPMPVLDNRMLALFRQSEPIKVWNYNVIPGGINTFINPVNILTGAAGRNNGQTAIIATTSTLNFDNGRAFYSSHSYMNGQLEKFFSNTDRQPFDIGMIQNIGIQKLVGFISLKLNMQSLSELLKDQMDKNEEGGLFEKMIKNGISPSDMLTAFTGDVFIGCSHPGREKEEVPPALVAMLKISNIEAAERILNKWKADAQESDRRKNEWYGMNKDKTLVIFSTSKETAEAFIAGNGMANDKTLEEEIKANPFYLQVNMNELYTIMMRMETPKKEKEKAVAELLNNIQLFKITAGKYEQGAVSLQYELSFNNKEDNGFRQMMLMYDKIITNLLSEPETPANSYTMPREEVIINGQPRKSKKKEDAPVIVEEAEIGAINQEGEKVEMLPPPPPPPPPPRPKAVYKHTPQKETVKPGNPGKKE